jgi:hypothetical protein
MSPIHYIPIFWFYINKKCHYAEGQIKIIIDKEQASGMEQ